MKKLVLFVIFLSYIGVHGVFGQCTIDNTITQPGYYPNCTTGLPHDTVGKPYSTVLQIKVITDTMIGPLTATVDSIVITNVKGLPAGFSYFTNPGSKSFPGGSNGCILVSGSAPTSGMVGTYPLVINLTGYGKVLGSPLSIADSITCYSITIDPAASGIPEMSNTKFDLSKNFPDPVSRSTDIYYSVPMGGRLDFSVYNLLGKLVYQRILYADRGTGHITLDAKDFAPGIYMYSLSNGKATLTKRMVMAASY